MIKRKALVLNAESYCSSVEDSINNELDAGWEVESLHLAKNKIIIIFKR